jgi:hypothetical protein
MKMNFSLGYGPEAAGEKEPDELLELALVDLELLGEDDEGPAEPGENGEDAAALERRHARRRRRLRSRSDWIL